MFCYANPVSWKNVEHHKRTEADSALVLNVQRISQFFIDCKKSQLFLRKIFKVEHAEYCCGFNFKMFSKLQVVIYNNRRTRDAIML